MTTTSSTCAYFIPQHRLGVLQQSVESIQRFDRDKRKRSGQFKLVVRLLHDLNIVAREHPIKSLGMGCNSAGELGLIVVCELVRVEAELPQVAKPHNPGGPA